MPLPSGAHTGWATIWPVIRVVSGPSVEPWKGAITRFETCWPYVHTIATYLKSVVNDGERQSWPCDVSARPAYSEFGYGRFTHQIWLWIDPSSARRYFV